MYDYIQERIADYEKEILLVQELKAHCKLAENALSTLAPADLVAINAIGVQTVQVVLSE